jgi:tRNA-splicing ligase RtcB
VYDAKIADALGIHAGQLTVMIHSGSRGLGYQVCDDALRTIGQAMPRYGIAVPDRQLACVPISSPEAASISARWPRRRTSLGRTGR